LIVSGSSSLRIDHSLADLSRRHILVQAHGLCFGEWAALEHGMELSAYPYDTLLNSSEDIAYAVNKTFKDHRLSIVYEFHRYLAEGYFPSRRNYSNISLYYQSIENVMNAIIDQDIASRFADITEITRHKLKRLLGHIAGQCPFIPNISTLREALQLGDDKTVKRYLFMLNEGGVLNNLYQQDRSYKDIPRPEKIYLENTNFMYALQKHIDIGNLRETFAVGMLKKIVPISVPKSGDIITAGKDVFEVGGKGKTKKQVRNVKRAYVLNDDIDYAHGAHLPLWLLGFLW
jgi:predicted AAA+ superfamily ATPase